VAADGRVPAHAVVGLPRGEHEAADHALTALEVPVEDVDADALRRLDRATGSAVAVARRVAERALPEADVAGGDVEIAAERREVLQRRRDDVGATLEPELGQEVPPWRTAMPVPTLRTAITK
jgi:hypothetical protein